MKNRILGTLGATLAATLLFTGCSSTDSPTAQSTTGPAATPDDTAIPTVTDRGDTADELAKFGETIAPVRQDSTMVEQRKVFRDSASFRYLEAPQRIEPGARYYVQSSSGLSQCSFGWTVRLDDDADRTFNLTAGHCGDPGDVVLLDPEDTRDASQMVKVGEFVWQAYDGEERLATGDDYALIQFYPRFVTTDLMTGTPAVTMRGTPLTLAGWQDAEWLTENDPYMCRLGFRSGLSCGQFQEMTNATNVAYDAISDNGDSGGAVWAFDPDDPTRIYAVAVTSWINHADAATSHAKTVDKVMERLDLKILR